MERSRRIEPRNASPTRGGFTLIELLVVIAIIATLVAILLPAVQRAREAARANTCKSNLKQLGLALHNYHDVNKILPPGCIAPIGPGGTIGVADQGGWAWGAMLLPYIEQSGVYDQINFNLTLNAGTNANAVQQFIPAVTCPSDNQPPKLCPSGTFTMGNIARTSYKGNFGPYSVFGFSSGTTFNVTAPQWQTITTKNRGIFTYNSNVRFGDISDGLSSTILVGEIVYAFGTDDSGQSPHARWYGAASDQASPSGGVLIHSNAQRIQTVRRHISGSVCGAQTKMNSNVTNGVGSFGSRHSGGAQFVFGDGSVRFISDTIEHSPVVTIDTTTGNINSSNTIFGTYQKLFARDDGMVLGDF